MIIVILCLGLALIFPSHAYELCPAVEIDDYTYDLTTIRDENNIAAIL